MSLERMLEIWVKSRWHRFEMGNLGWPKHDTCVGCENVCVYVYLCVNEHVCECVYEIKFVCENVCAVYECA